MPARMSSAKSALVALAAEPPDAPNPRSSSRKTAIPRRLSVSATWRNNRIPPANGMYRSVPGNRPRSAFRSTLAKASFVERDGGYVTTMGTIVKKSSRYQRRDIEGGRFTTLTDIHTLWWFAGTRGSYAG